jgi:hypothetical protein
MGREKHFWAVHLIFSIIYMMERYMSANELRRKRYVSGTIIPTLHMLCARWRILRL